MGVSTAVAYVRTEDRRLLHEVQMGRIRGCSILTDRQLKTPDLQLKGMDCAQWQE